MLSLKYDIAMQYDHSYLLGVLIPFPHELLEYGINNLFSFERSELENKYNI
jgi:hypothetical protein